jgi:chromosome segregation ATPase
MTNNEKKPQPRASHGTPLETLRERERQLAEEVEGRGDAIAKLMEERGLALAQQHKRIDEAAIEVAVREERADQAAEDAAKQQLTLEGVILSWKKKIKAARAAAEELRDAVPDAEHELAAARDALRTLRAEWKQRMRGFVDGRIRRKQAELAKLRRRIAEKEALIERRKARKGKTLSARDIMYGATPKDLEVDDADKGA